jgi:hypothetical protein
MIHIEWASSGIPPRGGEEIILGSFGVFRTGERLVANDPMVDAEYAVT